MIDTNTDSIYKPFLFSVARFLIYALAVVLLAEVIRWDALQAAGNDKFSESSYTEYLQVVFLMISSIVLLMNYLRKDYYIYTSLLLFALTGASFIRELDDFFDSIFDGAWQLCVFSLIGYILLVVYKNRLKFLEESKTYLHSSSFGIFSGGLITTYIFSRLFGRKIFWYAVMEDQYFRSVKNAAEECIELYGYLLILISVLELVFASRKTNTIKK